METTRTIQTLTPQKREELQAERTSLMGNIRNGREETRDMDRLAEIDHLLTGEPIPIAAKLSDITREQEEDTNIK